MRRTLFLDLDGVLADFDRGSRELVGIPADEFIASHSVREFWFRVRKHPDFYGSLALMPDAQTLFEAVAHLDPVILTGLPIGNWAEPQKRQWVERHFPGTPVITCLARDKPKHLRATGDVLVDDREKFRAGWEEAGGTFVHHKSARETIAALATIYPSID